MNEGPLISVIVPIYNVAPYLRKCLDSLKGQTLKDIEVICIDDGSTDESGLIAGEYATDTRFRIIHTENRGLSAARNRGIDEAKADWLMFVDSDDWVDKEFCRIPYEAAVENEADLVIFRSYEVSERGRVIRKRKYKRPITTGLLECEAAIDNAGTVAWRKLYKRILFETVRYPEGHVYEDFATTHNLVYGANRIISISDQLYYHRHRKGSISQLLSSDKDRLAMSKLRCEELIKLGHQPYKAKIQVFETALRCYGRARDTDTPLCKEVEETLQRIKGIPAGFTGKEKAMMLVWHINKDLYRFIYKAFIHNCQ